MSKARELYGKELDDSWFCVCDYQPIVDSFGEVIVQDEDNDYSGDTRVIYYADGEYGFLNFGWGSCSGCDALQACRSEEDVNKLIESLEQDIEWFDTLKELKEYLTSKDRAVSYYSHEENWPDFVVKVLNLKEDE
jgi:hypothetical protein